MNDGTPVWLIVVICVGIGLIILIICVICGYMTHCLYTGRRVELRSDNRIINYPCGDVSNPFQFEA